MVDELETMAITKRLQITTSTIIIWYQPQTPSYPSPSRARGAAALHAEIAMLHVRNRRERRRGAVPDHPATLDQVMAIGDANQRVDILVDHQDRQALRLEPGEALPDLSADERRQAFGRLVENEQPRVGHQRPADHQHLLLAAREQVCHRVEALGEAREQVA